MKNGAAQATSWGKGAFAEGVDALRASRTGHEAGMMGRAVFRVLGQV